jgi:hypothetical protein
MLCPYALSTIQIDLEILLKEGMKIFCLIHPTDIFIAFASISAAGSSSVVPPLCNTQEVNQDHQ